MTEAAPVPSGGARRAPWVLAALIAVVWLAVLPVRPLFNPDEGRYAEIPREMLAGGDWVIPHLNGLAYVEKPPLQYWATAGSLWLFGEGEFAARLYTALCALATLAVVWIAAARLWSEAAAWRSAAVLAGMLLFPVMGQLLTLDMSLTFYMTVALAAFLLAQSGARHGMLIAWIATALGVLSKGLVAAAIPAAVLVLHSLYTRDLAPWRRLDAVRGLACFLVITVPWHCLAEHRLPGFAAFFFLHEHLARYLTPSADREEAWWFFIAVFALGCMPWTPAAVRVMCLGWRRRAVQGGFDSTVFLWIWVAFVGVFFSLSDSKLVPYVLPALPALALSIGSAAPAHWRRDVAITAGVTLLAAVAAAAAGLVGPHHLPLTERGRHFALLGPPLLAVALLLGVAGSWVLLQRRRDGTRDAVVLGAAWCLAGLMLMQAASAVAPLYSGIGLARSVPAPPPGVPLFSVGTYDQTLPFYWRRTFELVSFRGELDFGLQRAPGAQIAALSDFSQTWRGLPAAYAVMEKSMFEELKREELPMREVARDVHRVLVSRR